MNLNIDKTTKESLISDLNKKNKSAVRLMIKSFGWGGPILGIALDEQRENDEAFEVDGIKFVSEPDTSFLFNNSTIEQTHGIFGKYYNIISANGHSGC